MSGSRRSSRGSSGMTAERGIREKLRNLFGNAREEGLETGQGPSRRGSIPPLHLGQDRLRVLGPDNDLNLRLKQMQALLPLLSTKRLEPNSLDALWSQIRDLVPRCYIRSSVKQLPAETRTQFLVFLQTLAKHQLGAGPATEVLRSTLFDAFKDSSPGDFGDCDIQVFELVVILSERGTSGLGSDGWMGGFVVKWSEAIVRTVTVCSVPVVDWLAFLGDLVRNNAAGLETDDAEQLVHLLCVHASSIVQEGLGEDADKKVEEVRGCLQVLDRILRFSVFPRPLVHVLVTTLCKLVNAAALSELSWRVMRNVLSSYLGYTCVLRLCSLLECGVYTDPVVLRGAVFFLAMGLWGSQRVDALFYSPVAVLNSLRAGLSADSLIVTYEVLVSVKRLVEKYGKELQHLSWNCVLEIMDDVRKNLSDDLSEEISEKEEKVREIFHQVLDSMESLAERGSYSGNQGQLYALIESCSAQRPETSILRLLSFRAAAINVFSPTWIQDLHDLLWNYYFKDGRATVRIKVGTILRNVYRNNRHLHDAALLQQVVLPILRHLPEERDADVTAAALSLLADIAITTRARVKVPAGPRNEPTSVHSFRDAFLEILDIFERLINLGLYQYKQKPSALPDDQAYADDTFRRLDMVEASVKQLVLILRKKWGVSPAYHSLHVLRLLAKTLSLMYSVGLVDKTVDETRKILVLLLIQLKVNPATTRIALVFDPDVEESPYLFCHDPALGPPDYQEGSIEREVGIEWSWIADALLGVIRHERVWSILQLLLLHLPEFLKNRALILSTPAAIPEMTRALCDAASCREKVGTLFRPPETMAGTAEANLADFICPSLGILVAYRDNLEKRLQERIVSGIQTALVSGVSVRAVLGWILCIVELPNVVLGMSRELVALLDGLRKTPAMIIPVFELSSTLLRLPNLYAQFRESDFLHVFDALLPATDTFAFTTFIVAVGHHLVYRWFLKVPIPLRPRMAAHIRKRVEEIRIASDAKGPGGDPQLGKDEQILMGEFLRHYTFTNAPADADPPLPTLLAAMLKAQGVTRHWVQVHTTHILMGEFLRHYTFTNAPADADPPLPTVLAAMLKAQGVTRHWVQVHTTHILMGEFLRHYTFINAPADADPPLPTLLAAMLKAQGVTRHWVQVHTTHILMGEFLRHYTFTNAPTDADPPLPTLFAAMLKAQGVTRHWVQVHTTHILMGEFLRHYTFTNAPADADPPLPTLLAAMLKAQGVRVTRHWVQGNRVVSISAVMQRGYPDAGTICAKCTATLARAPPNVPGEETESSETGSAGPSDEFGAQRKRHQSAVQARVTRAPKPPPPTSHDDFHLSLTTQQGHVKPHTLCSCWCRGYALVEIRHPFGKSFWVMEVNGATVSRLQDWEAIQKLSRLLVKKRKESADESGGASEAGEEQTNGASVGELRGRSSSETSLPERGVLSPQNSLGAADGEKLRRSSGAGRRGGRPLNEPLSVTISGGSDEGVLGSGDSSAYASAKSTPCPPTLEEPSVPHMEAAGPDPPPGLNPAWLFAQLFAADADSEEAVQLPWHGNDGEAVARSLRNLDLLPPYEAHKIGVIYAAPKQTTETQMLANHHGTERYTRFLEGLGKLLPLKGGNQQGAHCFMGSLDPNGADGHFTYHWTDPITQVLFDVATLIPTKEREKECLNKKRHIGNDRVTIVYNDSGLEFRLETLSGQMAFVAIVVTPLHQQTLSLQLLAKDEISRWLSLKEAVVSDKEAPLLCRQISMRAEFSAHCWQSGQQAQASGKRGIRATYISGAMERLLHIRSLRARHQPPPPSPS